jgi:hypothetical protein
MSKISKIILGAFLVVMTSSAWADSISLYSSTSTDQGAAYGTIGAGWVTAPFTSVPTSGLTWGSVVTGYSGTSSWLPNESGEIAGTEDVSVAGTDQWGNQNSGFVKETFTLPSNANSISISGWGSVDDGGDVFLNGILIGQLTGQADTVFSANLASDFVAGTNTLIISDSNYSDGAAGVVYNATVNYTSSGSTSVTPEPGTLALLGLGIAGLALMLHRQKTSHGETKS